MLAVARPHYSGSMHDIDYGKIAAMMENARAQMEPGDMRIDTICPICGATAWVLRREPHEDIRYIVAQCEARCFECME